MIDLDTAAELEELAAAIARLRPISSRNPYAFYEDRSELASRARKLAGRLRTPARTAVLDRPAPTGPQSVRHEARHIGGRTVLVLTRSAR